jgi:sugar transferase (PEP-CTERM/EpsH1 system associated)
MHILWLKSELLHPVDKGGRIRTYHMLRQLKCEHQITYLTLDDGLAAPDALERASEYADAVQRIPFHAPRKGTPAFYADLVKNLGSRLPYAIAKYRSTAMRREIEATVRREDIDVLVCDFLAPSVNVPERLTCPTVLFQHNVEARIWERHAAVSMNPLARAYFREQWRRMVHFEAVECRRFAQVVAVSPEDREVFRTQYGQPEVGEVSTGVDTAFFRPTGTVAREPHDIVFTGSMDWLPNQDGILWFADTILPLVRQRIPGATLTVVGREAPQRIRALAEQDSGIRVTGTVPDVRPYLERAAVFVVPLRIGGGTRLKIYEAMAMERAVVSTTVGAEGLPLQQGREIVLADAPDAFAAAVAELLGNPARAEAIAGNAAALVRRSFGWDQVAQQFAELCQRARATRRFPLTTAGA